MENFIGEIRLFPYTFAPFGWLPCNGQTLAVSQYQALYTLIGIQFGGDGRSTFNLPNLNGRTVVGTGQLQGGQNYTQGQIGGSENVTLTVNNLPSHSHSLNCSTDVGTANTPKSNLLAATPVTRGSATPYGAVANVATMAPNAIGPTGAGTPVSNLQPYLAIQYCIATQGIYPPRP